RHTPSPTCTMLSSPSRGGDSVDGFFEISTWIAAIIGSVILLALYRLVTGNRRHA
ncbi:GlsB/YeaQ/YmgE family stress response membrane protein, partial [Streptomyces sp. NPDC000963]